MDCHYHLSIAHFFLLFLLTSSYMQSTTNLCFCLAGGALSSSVKTNPCIDEERQALLILKQHLVDPSGRLSSWVGHDCCRWEGISCNNLTGHVVKMDLRNRFPDLHSNSDEEWYESAYEKPNLGGKINASLLSLKHLNYLDLSSNDFYSNQVPKFLGDLKSLQYLNLSSASFGGEIPPSLGNLSSLNFLDLGLNYGLTSRNLNWLSRLSSLKYLDLGKVDLSTTRVNWVYAVNMLPSLAELHLFGCQIEIIPLISLRHINLTSLLVLDVSSNMFSSSFPSWLFNLTSLITLDISGNHFNGHFPKVIGNLCKLKVLSLSGNEFNGGIEEFWRSFSNCSNIALESLDLSSCELGSQLPVSLGMFKSLQNLYLSGNSLLGSIPYSIGNLSSLKTLDLSSNFMNGSIPDSIGSLSSLKTLDLSLNKLHGSIPDSIGNLSFLKTLDLSSNFMNGSIPDSIGSLSSLKTLDLSRNKLHGSIPDSIGNLTSLKTLDLSSNFMNGSIPQSLGQLSQLFFLHLRHNPWEGILTEAHLINLTRLQDFEIGEDRYNDRPKSLIFEVAYDWVPPFKLHKIEIINYQIGPGFGVWLQSQTELVDVTLSGNGISDSIPKEWLSKISSQLIQLNLSYNQFCGILPSHLKFPSLTNIDLSHNQLEGPVPIWWSTQFISLILESNLFSGPIPSNIDQMMPNLTYLSLSENHLNGTIPLSISNMQQLQGLSLRSNQFSGELPHAWSGGTNMVFLDFSHNTLSGNIPTSFGVLSSLQVLKLNNNNFGGEIPDSLQNCSHLMSIDLGDNKLCGNIPLWIGGSNESMLYRIRLRSNYFSGHLSQQLCNLRHLHILDLSHNNLSGTIPKCLDNLASLVNDSSRNSNQSTEQTTWTLKVSELVHGKTPDHSIEQTTLTLKGSDLVYNKTLDLVKSIDLSSNNLQGEIPEEISSLIVLGTLNLSRNQLTGKIPSKIGNLHLLETLDLSHNLLSGQIPQSLASLTFLNHLNLSYNNLSGRIPWGNQLQTLNVSSIYMKNPWLCGIPLSTKCPGDDTFPSKDTKDRNEGGNDELWFYVSMVLGFIVGFWGVCGTLILKTSWRYAYFQFFDNIKDKVALTIALKVARFRRMFYDV